MKNTPNPSHPPLDARDNAPTMPATSTAPARKSAKEMAGVFWRLLRPHTLTASFIPVLLGTALAWRESGRLDGRLLAAMLVASILIQSATNNFNEYFDFVRGLDTAASVGHGGTLTHDGLRPRTVLLLAIGFLAVATLLGVYICAMTSWWLAAIGAVSMLVGFLYTGGPWPIAASPFGELFAGGFMGCGIVLLACFVQLGRVGGVELAASVPTALLIGAILTANNLRDRVGDQTAGRRTLVILLGHRGGVALLGATMLVANLWVAGMVMLGLLPVRALIVFLSLIPAARAVSHFARGGSPAEMMPAMQRVAQTNTIFGLLLLVGLL